MVLWITIIPPLSNGIPDHPILMHGTLTEYTKLERGVKIFTLGYTWIRELDLDLEKTVKKFKYLDGIKTVAAFQCVL